MPTLTQSTHTQNHLPQTYRIAAHTLKLTTHHTLTTHILNTNTYLAHSLIYRTKRIINHIHKQNATHTLTSHHTHTHLSYKQDSTTLTPSHTHKSLNTDRKLYRL